MCNDTYISMEKGVHLRFKEGLVGQGGGSENKDSEKSAQS